MYRLNYEKRDMGSSFALAVGVMIIASLVLGLVFGQASGPLYWVMQALYTVLIGGSAFIYAAITKTNVVAATKLAKPPKYAHFLWGCLAVAFLIFCMTPLNNWLMDAIEALGLPRPSVNMDDNLAGLLVVACLLPCFTEEIVFRGTVAQSLEGNKNKLAALAISGALFALFHANPAQTVHQFVLGAFLTLLVYRSGSLWTSVIVHFFNNALVVVLSYCTPLGADTFWTAKSNLGWVLALFFVGIAGFSLCVFGYVKTTKSVWQQNELQDSETEQDSVSKNTERNVTSTVLLFVAVGVCLALWVTSLFVQ